MASPQLILITGPMASGKSTLAAALAERRSKAVHLRGDAFRRNIVRGRVDMGNEPQAEALQQLRLRYRLAVRAAEGYLDAGFDVIYQDVILGPVLNDVLAWFQPLKPAVVVLCPDGATLARRDAARDKTGYGGVSVAQLLEGLNDTPRVGFWLDNSDQSVEQSLAAVEHWLQGGPT